MGQLKGKESYVLEAMKKVHLLVLSSYVFIQTSKAAVDSENTLAINIADIITLRSSQRSKGRRSSDFNHH